MRLAAFLAEQSAAALEKMIFYNCGPAPMIHASEAVQQQFVRQIAFSARSII
jgi:hypothetical protein